ncbi:MAG: UDP-N-acetylglucosamine 2-epimerase [Candidatus Omnitrophica bacterium CG1_02_46_14]|nr:MAG: UDP-N-acetylglucosamine 2-epimerase [Candidatus Omnitrophica bacterium CG1_02_46_14]
MIKKIKIAVVFGTRPEAIKMAPVVKALEADRSRIKLCVIVTGQHRQMLDQIMRLFKIKAHHDLDIMVPNQTLAGIVSIAVSRIDKIFKEEKPDLVLVQGDTTTSFVAALAAYFHKIPIGHVEAGLRTYNKYEPFPEEMNRRLTGALADLHFAPTQTAYEHLVKEGVDKKKLFITGNTVIDALLMTVKKNFDFGKLKDPVLSKKLSEVDFKNHRIILVTAHRRESFGKPFSDMCEAIREVVKKNKDVEVIYPVHLNPNVLKPVNRILGGLERVHLIPPLDYEIFTQLMNKSFLILTDSGGVQEESPSLGKPVLVMRNVTERSEAIKAGTVRLVGTDKRVISKEVQKLLDNKKAYQAMSRSYNPYGDGKAAERICKIILRTTRHYEEPACR